MVPDFPEYQIAGRPVSELYANWPLIVDHFRSTITAATARNEPPRQMLAHPQRFRQMVADQARSVPHLGLSPHQIDDIAPALHDEFFGLGLLRPWLANPDVEDIIMDSCRSMDVLIRGVKHPTQTPFEDDEDAAAWMQRMILERSNRNLSANEPIATGRLRDGSRIICVLPPVALHPAMVIRKHKVAIFDSESYPASGIAPVEFFADLRTWVRDRRLNVIVSGATGAGKTTFLNYAASLIDPMERIIVLEDTPELQIPHDRVLAMRALQNDSRTSRPGEMAIVLKDLLKHSLRMTPNRIIVGEVRDSSAYDLLDAFNTGHSGGLSTLHSNSPRDAIVRLKTLAAGAQENMPISVLEGFIATSIDVIVQIVQNPRTGDRRVVEAVQVLHPLQLPAGTRETADTMPLSDSVWIHRLWRWDNATGRLEHVGDAVDPGGSYFVE